MHELGLFPSSSSVAPGRHECLHPVQSSPCCLSEEGWHSWPMWKGDPPPPRPLVGSAASLPPSLDPEAGRPLMQGQWDRAMAGLPCLANTDLFAYDASSR